MLGVSQKLLIGVSVAFLSINGIEAAHAYQVFDNREQWEAALSSPTTTFDFSNVAGEILPPAPDETSLPHGLTVSYSGISGVQNLYPNAVVSGVVTSTGLSISGSREIGGGPSLVFRRPVEAIGFDLSSVGATDFGNFLIAFPTIIGNSYTGEILSIPASAPSFFGFIADPGTSFNEVDVRCRANDCIAIGGVDVNNISVSSAIKSVPEPSSTLGLSAALGVFFALNLKSKQQKYL